ncbi:GNAT family N-acetyltransferase [Nocardia sp. NPDC046763]|uniref:GNAT family N-acetyltransferase n=1 Tax=Nocardia sp. NPDC046763 TaxID=3155256 RepID=UPI0033EC594E
MLRTGRLTLTPVCASDRDELVALWHDPLGREFLFDGEMLSPGEITRIITNSEKSFATANFGLWAIRERSGGPLLGTAGLRELDGGPDLEIVYSLTPACWGGGLAGEAAAVVLDYAFDTLGLDRVLAEIDEGNTASRAVVERLGMRPFGTVPGVLGPMIHYALTRPRN